MISMTQGFRKPPFSFFSLFVFDSCTNFFISRSRVSKIGCKKGGPWPCTGIYKQACSLGAYNSTCSRRCCTACNTSCHSPFNDLSHSIAYGRSYDSHISEHCVVASIFKKYHRKDAPDGGWIHEFDLG